MPKGMGDLVLTVRDDTGKSLKSEATVHIFAESRLVDAGDTKSGFYRAVLPKGKYDISVTYPSTPRTGYLKKDIEIEDGVSKADTFVLPAEGSLRVLVRTKNGGIPRRDYTINVTSAERLVHSSSSAYNKINTFLLSTSLVYDVNVKYEEELLEKTGVRVQGDKTEEVKLSLPYNEADLIVLLRTKSGNIPRKSFSVAVSHKGTVVASNSSVSEKFKTFLRDDRAYLITINYQGQEQHQTGVTVVEDSPKELPFVLPWDEGTLTVLVRAGGRPLPESARIVITDSAGKEVAGDYAKDRYTVILHTEEEYTIRILYKDQPEQQKKVRVSADRLTEETFSFAQ